MFGVEWMFTYCYTNQLSFSIDRYLIFNQNVFIDHIWVFQDKLSNIPFFNPFHAAGQAESLMQRSM
jgi:hypothetical protein